MSTPETVPGSRSLNVLLKVLGGIERLGNRLPHPFWLFVLLSAVLALLSWGLAAAGVSAVNPATGKTVTVKSLVSADGVRMMVGDAIENYTSFPPLGTILVVMLGVAVAERSGLLAAVLRSGVAKVSPRWVTFALAFTGMVAHVASDAAYVVLIPLGALAFRAVGRSPILGIVVAFVSISAGYDASPLVTPTDAILSGLTTAAAHTIDPAYLVTPLANYFFSLASSLVLAGTITLVTERVLARRVESMPVDPDAEEDDLGSLTLRPEERRGLRAALITLVVFAAALTAAVLPAGSPLRGEDGGIVQSPLLTSIAIFLGLAFLAVGWAYGRAAGTVTGSGDIPAFMAHGLREMAPILVLFFAISQFLASFKWTGIGEIVAIDGAGLLKSAGVSGPVVFLGILLVVTVINLVVTSGSAQWALVGPVFVPMLMLLHIPPEHTQALYRIADSCTNAITPMSPYFVMALGFLQRYRRSAGIGTLASMTIPLALALLVVWTLLFFAFWGLGIPLGPGAPVP
ncbi:Aminobenzoyl-glutamate transport protein [[Actinomadura] parvosata subsp. kistnae]|uniref:p-aminobenzoyl-glutamate transporter n=1 Tax=[Actinomadura] parvosata subsp. kistnae TaxID=1909395 RepID=A0A1V0A6T0_9ACTN|nr:AbgT family transporter [Nonomuraea sp. ATCC 55076]AQZ65908.1 p-aminobenzoyl-glutamate transporter [Nonomuraea sp. ATCC 55076]SPL97358.1 Aminobenzoyl-glutamate transport protein [Actinomadura parvosata subsp. kistnae]